jgi:hypothetical protein
MFAAFPLCIISSYFASATKVMEESLESLAPLRTSKLAVPDLRYGWQDNV